MSSVVHIYYLLPPRRWSTFCRTVNFRIGMLPGDEVFIAIFSFAVFSEELALPRLVCCELSRFAATVTAFSCPLTYAG